MSILQDQVWFFREGLNLLEQTAPAISSMMEDVQVWNHERLHVLEEKLRDLITCRWNHERLPVLEEKMRDLITSRRNHERLLVVQSYLYIASDGGHIFSKPMLSTQSHQLFYRRLRSRLRVTRPKSISNHFPCDLKTLHPKPQTLQTLHSKP